MGQLFGNKYLKFLAALQGRTIEHDEPCGECGYNLRGVRYGGVCPECGSPIVLGKFSERKEMRAMIPTDGFSPRHALVPALRAIVIAWTSLSVAP